MMKGMSRYSFSSLLQKEPAALAAGVQSVISILVVSGLVPLSGEVQAAIVAGVAVLAGLFVRARVTPISSGSSPELEDQDA